MKWYKFWKKSGPNAGLTEEYKLFPDDWGESTIKAECENWAGHIGGGFGTSYTYGFEEASPPQEVRVKLTRRAMKRIEKECELLNALMEVSDEI